MSAVISLTGQVHDSIKRLIKERIHHKLILFEGEAKHSKVKSIMKLLAKEHFYGDDSKANCR